MEKNCAPLPLDIIPQTVKTPMKGSDFDFNNINMNNNQENSDSDDSGDFTPNNPNKPKKPKKEDKVEILGKNIIPDLKFKIIVVGNMNVGKSCLALRATEGLFREDLGSTVPLSICNFNVKINDKKISLQIWDTCGQEKYRALIKSYYTNSSLAIIVYSVTDKDSFEDMDKNVFAKLPRAIATERDDWDQRYNDEAITEAMVAGYMRFFSGLYISNDAEVSIIENADKRRRFRYNRTFQVTTLAIFDSDCIQLEKLIDVEEIRQKNVEKKQRQQEMER